MRVVLQRVSRASVSVAGECLGRIGVGYLLLVAFREGDDEQAVEWMAEKVANLRLFSDREGKLNLPLEAVAGGVLAVSQFTLYGDARKGRRPSFIGAAPPEVAKPLFDRFVGVLRTHDLVVETGEFGARMEIELVNDGPVTLILER